MAGKDQEEMLRLDCLAAVHVMDWEVRAVWPARDLKAPKNWDNLTLRAGPRGQYELKETILPTDEPRGLTFTPTRDLSTAFRVAEEASIGMWDLKRREDEWWCCFTCPAGETAFAKDETAAVAIVKAAIQKAREGS